MRLARVKQTGLSLSGVHAPVKARSWITLSGVPSKLVVFPDEGHWILKPQNSEFWYNNVLADVAPDLTSLKDCKLKFKNKSIDFVEADTNTLEVLSVLKQTQARLKIDEGIEDDCLTQLFLFIGEASGIKKDDKIFYYEKRLTAGVRFDLRHVGFEVYGGWAFDRFYYEGERYGERHDNRIDVGDGPFIVGKVSVRF